MTKNGSASARKQESRTLDANLKRRARKTRNRQQSRSKDRSLINYGLEITDKYIEQVVNRLEAGEKSIDHICFE